MKKIMICLAALLMTSTMATAQKVTVADVKAMPGETVAFTVSMSEGKTDTYTAFGFSILFPTEGFTTIGVKNYSPSWQDAAGLVGDVNASNMAIAGFYAAEPMAGNAINNLVSIEFTVDSDMPLGDYEVTLLNPTFEYGFAEADVANDVTFTVHVVENHGDPTGITDVSGKMAANTYFNLHGHQVETPKKGVYIVNGSKIVVK